MKKLIASVFLTFVVVMTHAQIKKPAKWSDPVLSNNSPKIGETIEIAFNATIDAGWYLYSSDFDPDLGPIVTTFDYEGSSGVEIVGKIQPVNPKKAYDDLWGGDYTYFEPKGQFKQKVKITAANPTVKVKIEYQTCQHEGSCISDKKKFEIAITTSTGSSAKSTSDNTNGSEESKSVNTNSNTVTSTPSKEPKETDKNQGETGVPEVNIESMQFSVDTSTVDPMAGESVVETKPVIEGAENIVSSKDGIGQDFEGKNWVLVNNRWSKVPEGNSPQFYKKYLEVTSK